MKIFYDTEFIERGPSLPIELVSIGMIREDGETLYLINADVSLSNLVRHPWLQINVVPYLPINIGQDGFILAWDADHPDYRRVRSLDSIAEEVRDFCTVDDHTATELWAYFGAYDHVVMAQIFGTMSDYPPGMPMYTNDIAQLWWSLGGPAGVLPIPAPALEHHALGDAEWVRAAYGALKRYEEDSVERAVGVIGHPQAGKTELTNGAIETATGQRPLPESAEQDNPGGFE